MQTFVVLKEAAAIVNKAIMNSLALVLSEIVALTGRIKKDYPELYEQLEENKVSVEAAGRNISGDEFAEYLDSLKEKLKHYIENQDMRADPENTSRARGNLEGA